MGTKYGVQVQISSCCLSCLSYWLSQHSEYFQAKQVYEVRSIRYSPHHKSTIGCKTAVRSDDVQVWVEV